MKKIINKLRKLNRTIAIMESCTGGYIVNKITNIPGSSDVLKYSAVTYSNEYKIKMGVSKEIIDKYSVYSQEVADEMSYKIACFSNSDYGVGVTGKLLSSDQYNKYGEDDEVFISLYDKVNDKYTRLKIKINYETREKNKELVYNNVVRLLDELLNIK